MQVPRRLEGMHFQFSFIKTTFRNELSPLPCCYSKNSSSSTVALRSTTSLHRSAEDFEARQHTEVFLYGHTCKTSTDGGREKRVSNYTDLTKRLSLYVILNLSTKFLVHHQTPFMSLRSDYRHESVDLLLSKHKINNRSIMGQLVTELMTIV
ncbi:hypothetical protein KUTeg_001255 [Tegillarca granosa]|uniref:Uncharacterized protein n=1 Tax=Tegillarca granosa TaxID=220873 RepID=A0ABQ9FYL2_TEGGR|nr:hypothetical protein KUTeg_001255 [Tegillarca granosa]